MPTPVTRQKRNFPARKSAGLPNRCWPWDCSNFAPAYLPRAEKLLAEARKTANPYDLDQIWRIERALAAVSAARKQHDLAEAHFELALTALEGGRERLRPEEFALSFGSDRLRLYDEYASYLAGRAIETAAVVDAEKAMLVVERRRGQALWDLMSQGWAGLRPEAVPEQLAAARVGMAGRRNQRVMYG